MNKSTYTHRRTHYYRIGGHQIGIDAAEALALSHLLPSFCPFAVEPCPPATPEESLFVMRIATGATLPSEPDACTQLTHFEWEGGQCMVLATAPGTLCLRLRSPHSLQEGWMEATGGSATVWLPQQADAAAFVLSNFLMMFYAFTAASRHTLLVHASVVAQQGQAFLFLGPSGTGKSTHSALWLRHVRGSELMNDDNPILRIAPRTGEVTAYGSPWSGKTPCYRPMQAPVAAIVRLNQALRNNISQQDTAHAFATLLPSCSCLKQDVSIYNGVLQTVSDVIEHTPIYRFDCLPDWEAAVLCYRTTGMQAGVYDPKYICHE